MPTYDYRCQACDHEMEVFQSMTANPLRKCPECGRMKLKRLIGTGAGIIFKGSGFYETDYRSESYRKQAKAESESANGKGEDKKKKEDTGKSSGESGGGKTESSTSGASASSKSD